MSRIDSTTEWPELRGNPVALQRFILDLYEAERIELAPFPNAALYARDGKLLGFVKTYGYPRIATEGDQVYLDLAPLIGMDDDEMLLISIHYARWVKEYRIALRKAGLSERAAQQLAHQLNTELYDRLRAEAVHVS